MRTLLAFLLLITLPLVAFAQGDRYELGLRVRMLEEAFETKRTDADAKKRACDPANKAVMSFFSLNFTQASKNLDTARYALLSDKTPSDAVLYAETLTLRAVPRWVDVKETEFLFTISQFYKHEGKAPEGITARMKIGAGGWKETKLAELPLTISYPAKEIGDSLGELPVLVEIRQKETVLATRKTSISRTKDLATRLKKIKDTTMELNGLEAASARGIIKILDELANKGSPETEYPANRLLEELEAIYKEDKKYYTHEKAGQFWLTIPLVKSPPPVRVFIPKKLDKDKPVPVVVALHGAGGSENMFFDAYGAGITQKLCEERGWVMVATRAAGAFGVGAPRQSTRFSIA